MERWKTESFGVVENGRRESELNNIVGFHELVLTVTALLLTLAAAVILGVNKQTEKVAVELTAALPTLYVPVTAKWHYLSALVYFMVANGIACSYAAFSLLLLTAHKRRRRITSVIIVIDTLTVALLFSGVGAATAVGVIGLRGNSHVQWNKICHVFGRFCGQGAASLLLSLIGATVFLSLALITALKHHRKYCQ